MTAHTARGTGLTARQQAILEVIRDGVRRRGYAPSYREIAKAVGLVSSSTVAYQLKVLEGKGLLRRTAGVPRALAVPTPTDACPSCAGTGRVIRAGAA